MNAGVLSRTRSAAVAVLLVVLSPAVRASPEAAHAHYTRAIELTRRGELSEAKREFERAHAESPHSSVLYNLARVCLDLGELEEARRYGEQFLAQAGPDTPRQHRQDIQRMLEELPPPNEKTKLAHQEPAPLPAPSGSTAPRAPLPESPASSPPERAASVSECPGCLPPEQVDSVVARERWRAAGIALGAAGAVVLAAGAGLLVWNHAQVSEAEREQDALAGKRPKSEIMNQQELLAILAYERAVSENEAELRATDRFAIAGWSAVGLGVALAGTGVILVLTHPRRPAAALAWRGETLSFTTNF